MPSNRAKTAIARARAYQSTHDTITEATDAAVTAVDALVAELTRLVDEAPGRLLSDVEDAKDAADELATQVKVLTDDLRAHQDASEAFHS